MEGSLNFNSICIANGECLVGTTSTIYFSFLTFAILTRCLGLLLTKKGATVGNVVYSIGIWANFKALINVYTLAGVFFGLSLTAWIIALKKIALSLAFPLGSFSHTVISIIFLFFVREWITVFRIIGTGLIILGIFIMVQR